MFLEFPIEHRGIPIQRVRKRSGEPRLMIAKKYESNGAIHPLQAIDEIRQVLVRLIDARKIHAELG